MVGLCNYNKVTGKRISNGLKVIILTFALVILWTVSAYSYWIWTPETGKWINPKYAVKDSPQEQLQWAMNFYDAKSYSRAIKEFRKLITHYPLSALAAEAQYHIGLSWENLEEDYQAFLAYQKTLDTYLYTSRTEEIIGKEYRIGNLFYAGKKRKILGMTILPAKDKAIEVFRAVVDNAPYGKYADVAQYKIGLCFKENGDFAQAKLEFEKVLKKYPESNLAEDAQYQIALSALESSLDYDYDQGSTDKALKDFKKVIISSPYADISKEEVDTAIRRLEDKKAKKAYKIGEFYERQGHTESAAIYYNDVIKGFPETLWAAKALERLQVIEKKE